MEQLKDAEIQTYLGTYREEYKLVKNVIYTQGEIKAELIPFIYPFTMEDSGYVNATQINLYLSQLAYILMAKSINDPKFSLVSKFINLEEFQTKMHARRLFFGSLTIKMKRVIYKRESSIGASMKIVAVKKVTGSVFCEIEFELGKRASVGTLLASIT